MSSVMGPTLVMTFQLVIKALSIALRFSVMVDQVPQSARVLGNIPGGPRFDSWPDYAT